jgi:hypothetical protein
MGFTLHRLPLANQASAILHVHFDYAQRKRFKSPSVPRRLIQSSAIDCFASRLDFRPLPLQLSLRLLSP